MNEETFNIEVRRFLKTFGVSAQREIERAARDALASGRIRATDKLKVRAKLEIDGLDAGLEVDSEIGLT